MFACFDSASEFNMHVEKITLSDMPEDEDDEYMAQLELLDERILQLYRLAHSDSAKIVSEKVALRKVSWGTRSGICQQIAAFRGCTLLRLNSFGLWQSSTTR